MPYKPCSCTMGKVSQCGDGMYSGPGDISITIGQYVKNPKSYNTDNACNWLSRNAYGKSQGYCAKYVRLAIEKGFNDTNSTAGRPNWAWLYTKYLPTIGFEYLTGEFEYKNGDIAVYQKGDNPNVPGHICMFCNGTWISDFKQNGVMVYSHNTPSNIYYFRFKG